MTTILRRNLLALMIGAATVTFVTPMLFDAPAYAKNSSDDGAAHDSNDDNGGASGSGSDDNSSDDSDSGSSSDSDSNDSDDSNSSSSDSDDDANDDSSNDLKKPSKSEKESGGKSSRPTATITLSPASLASVQSGTHVVVDQLGRPLEISVVTVNGQQVIRAKAHGGASKRKPDPITDIKVVPVASIAGNDDGTPDQGQGDN